MSKNGGSCNVPSVLATCIVSTCSATNRRPSGARSIAVVLVKGLGLPPAKVVWVKPDVSVPTLEADLLKRKIGSSPNSRATQITNSSLYPVTGL